MFMDPTGLPSHAIPTDATSSLDRVDSIARFEGVAFPQGALRPPRIFPPPINENLQINFSSVPHTLYAQSSDRGTSDFHRTDPEVSIIYSPTTVAVTGNCVRTDGQHFSWTGSFFPGSPRSPVVTPEIALQTLPSSSPTISTTPPTRDDLDGGSWTSSCRDHYPQHQGFSQINDSFILSEHSPTNPPFDPHTCLPEIRSHTPYPQATTGNAFPTSPATPQVITMVADECVRSLHRGREGTKSFPADHVHLHVEAPGTSLLALPSPSPTANWIKIPQVDYDFGKKQLGFEPLEPVSFSTKNGLGINLRDALDKKFACLENPDDPMLQHTSSILCRFLFPGYPDDHNTCQRIQVLNSAKERKPISRAKLAHEIAKKLKKYLDHMAVITPHRSVEDRWKIGQGFMRIDNMFLVRFVSVSKGSFQPEIWVVASPALARTKAEL